MNVLFMVKDVYMGDVGRPTSVYRGANDPSWDGGPQRPDLKWTDFGPLYGALLVGPGLGLMVLLVLLSLPSKSSNNNNISSLIFSKEN
ncbi:hypothetical protein AMTR_s00001p00273110 [Amborella trichopoda]|uniref:Uncharacterized protein n=1 Tax=Amborella trichopoda TaxID=13333 RepID=W1NML6_AMBTC|nr:hypothetical protein AMTR_s00001p00273110 [Amborella trichopoda]